MVVKLSNQYGTRSSQWQPHIDSIVAKASRLRELAIDALVRSALEYGGSI